MVDRMQRELHGEDHEHGHAPALEADGDERGDAEREPEGCVVADVVVVARAEWTDQGVERPGGHDHEEAEGEVVEAEGDEAKADEVVPRSRRERARGPSCSGHARRLKERRAGLAHFREVAKLFSPPRRREDTATPHEY